MQRRAKIVCTLGPSTESEEAIASLIEAGMDVARLNFSHGDHEFHRQLVERVRRVSSQLGKPVAIMQDLQGPKIRCLKMEGNGVVLKEGAQTTITIDDILGTAERFGTSYKLLPRDVNPGDPILLDDGNLALRVVSKTDRDVVCEILNGGLLKDKKGINLPNSKVSASSLSDKDIRDAQFGAEVGVDAVALSFVRTRHDVRQLRRILAQSHARPLIIAKIEKPQALDQLDGIMEEADGVMVARGDLGVEMPTEVVPIAQKTIVEEANRRGKIVIVATQMLESMITNPRPTRAEASDVANAVLDGADALMLSGETASGKHPRTVVETMAKIITHVEQSERARYVKTVNFLDTNHAQDFQNAVAQAAVRAAHELKARSIVVYTSSGNTARLVSDYRPRVPILAFVPNDKERRRLAFAWGVQSAIFQHNSDDTAATLAELDQFFLTHKLAEMGDTIVLVTKSPFINTQRTNTMHLHVVGSTSLHTMPQA